MGETTTGAGSSLWGANPNVTSVPNFALPTVNSLNIKFYGENNTVILNSPADNSSVIDNFIFNVSSSNTFSSLKNITLFVWNSTNGIFLQQNKTITGSTNNSVLNSNVTTFNIGSYKWNAFVCSVDNSCLYALNNKSFTYGYSQNAITYNASTIETSQEPFILNITLASGVTLSSATLNYGGTNYTTSTAPSGTNTIISRTFDIPTISSAVSNNFSWYLSLLEGATTTISQTTVNTQTVDVLNFSNVSIGRLFLNITFKNETTAQESVNASIPSMSVVYYAGTGTTNKTFTFSRASALRSYLFYVNQNSSTITSIISMTYENAESTTRSYSDTLTLTNITTNKTLYLLPLSEGSLVSFQILSVTEQPLSGVTVNVTRSGFGLVESRTTSGSGTVTFFLDPLATYTVCAQQSGGEPFCTTDAFTAGTYTITLGSDATEGDPVNYMRGMTWAISPTGTQLTNNTAYTFRFDLDSSFFTVSEFGFVLFDGKGNVIGSDSTSSNGGLSSTSVNTVLNTTVRMNAYWIVDGNYTNITYQWYVINTDDQDFSLWRFFTDFVSYTNSSNGDSDGLFGLQTGEDNISLQLILFFFILVVVGIVTTTYGISSNASIFGIIFGIVFIFDVIFELVPRPVLDIPIVTVLLGVLFISFLIKEVNY